ncbi:GPR50 [Branchiostoma lanceolatum]|uniref:GPR50 protein n=1 Tax=Branchiostoma lanceolatum TaxID=7740 RepID=A0A8J9VXG6_BRALA|nr:GPR50 [Branchiostoma lanceolatum]
MNRTNISSTCAAAYSASTTEVSELSTSWPTVQTFAMDSGNESTSTYGNGTGLEANLPTVNEICVAELFAAGFGLISIIGTFGNLLVITSLLVNKKLRTSLNAFITSMAMGDLIFAGVHEPLSARALATAAITSMAMGHLFAGVHEPLYARALAIGRRVCMRFSLQEDEIPIAPFRYYCGLTSRPMLCTVLGAATVASASQSLIASTLIAINRFILIEYPHTVYKKVFTRCNTFFMIAGSWTLSVLVVLPPLLGFGELGYNRASSICDFAVDNSSTFIYFMTIPGVLVLVSNGVTVFCYFKIYQKVKQSAVNAHGGPGPNNGGRQVPGKVLKQTKHMFVMFVTFCVCTTPYSLFYTADRDMALSPCLWQTLTLLFACNSSINPVIHTCRSRDYRDAFRYIVCCGRRKPTRKVTVAKKITVQEKDAANLPKARALPAPGVESSPPSDSTDTSPLQHQRGTIAVTHTSGQPLSSLSTGYKSCSTLVVQEMPGVSV